jgi:antitoxin CcdA
MRIMSKAFRETAAAHGRASGSARKATNVTIDAEVLKRAKDLGINLSQALEMRLIELIRESERTQWRTENREAIDAYNQRIERDGAFGDRFRRF